MKRDEEYIWCSYEEIDEAIKNGFMIFNEEKQVAYNKLVNK